MPVDIEYLGWSAFRLTTENGTRIVIDPFLDQKRLDTLWNHFFEAGVVATKEPPPAASVKDLSDTHLVLVTHSARDHFGQVLELMKTSNASLFCGRDVSLRVLKEDIPPERVWHLAPGIGFNFADVHVKAVEASHISLAHFEGHWLTGVPLSFIIDFGADGKIFFGGDDALGMHHRLIGEVYKPDLAVLGIGGSSYKGQFRRDLPPADAAVAAKWLNVKTVIPMHFLSSEDEELRKELAKQVPGVILAVMKPGERSSYSKTHGLKR